MTHRSSRPEVFLGKGVLKKCSKFIGEYPCRSAISIKLQRNFITLLHYRIMAGRGSRLEVLLGKSVLKICSKFTGERTLMPKSDFNKIHTPAFLKNTTGRVLLDRKQNFKVRKSSYILVSSFIPSPHITKCRSKCFC